MKTAQSPTARVAANRRRVFIWTPLLLAGLVLALAGAPMITVFNSQDALGLALVVTALLGFIKEVE